MNTLYKEHLIVRNFGPIKEIDIDIYPFTIFIGSQASGKSTISKLLTICRDMSWQMQILDGVNTYEPFKKFCIDEFFFDDTYIKYTQGTEEVTYEKGAFCMKNNGYPKEVIKEHLEKRIFEENAELLSKLGVDGMTNEEIREKYSNLLSANARTLLYIPAERNMAGSLSTSLASIIAAQVPLYDALVEYMSVFERAKNYLKEYEVKFLNAKFEKVNGRERIVLTDKEDEESLPLNACSSGLQSVLPLIMVMEYALKVRCFDSFVIEEPEQNLFPENQRELMQFLVKSFSDGVNNLIITTHSPYTLSVLNNLIYAAQVGQKKTSEVNSIIPQESWIHAENVSAYLLHDGTAESIMDEELHQIQAEKIDSISGLLNKQYDQLMDLEYDGKE